MHSLSPGDALTAFACVRQVPACTTELATVLSSRNGSSPGPQGRGASYAWDTDYLVYANDDYSATYVNGTDPPPYWGLGACHAATDPPSTGSERPPKLERKGNSFRVGDCTVFGTSFIGWGTYIKIKFLGRIKIK